MEIVKNDKWQVEVYGKEAIQNYKFKDIYQMGKAIFETNSIEEGWDGTLIILARRWCVHLSIFKLTMLKVKNYRRVEVF